MTKRFAILTALLVTLAACQSTSGTQPSGNDCSQINESNRDRCLTSTL